MRKLRTSSCRVPPKSESTYKICSTESNGQTCINLEHSTLISLLGARGLTSTRMQQFTCKSVWAPHSRTNILVSLTDKQRILIRWITLWYMIHGKTVCFGACLLLRGMEMTGLLVPPVSGYTPFGVRITSSIRPLSLTVNH